jgi:hypothetical protein
MRMDLDAMTGAGRYGLRLPVRYSLSAAQSGDLQYRGSCVAERESAYTTFHVVPVASPYVRRPIVLPVG